MNVEVELKWLSLGCLIFLTGISAVSAAFASAQQTGWTTTHHKNPVTGHVWYTASSPVVAPVQPMSFPYQGTRAWLASDCSGEVNGMTYVGFNQAPNLNFEANFHGINLIHTVARQDKKVISIALLLQPGSHIVRIVNSNYPHNLDFPLDLSDAHTVVIEFPWYGNGATYFKFSLKGARRALDLVAHDCLAEPIWFPKSAQTSSNGS